ncbi:MAG TPA: hypothetical protein PK971_12355, partial [Saprospiraceae bacterium]|nr:hypothetical protein [Saprospiraceae bacterium]
DDREEAHVKASTLPLQPPALPLWHFVTPWRKAQSLIVTACRGRHAGADVCETHSEKYST